MKGDSSKDDSGVGNDLFSFVKGYFPSRQLSFGSKTSVEELMYWESDVIESMINACLHLLHPYPECRFIWYHPEHTMNVEESVEGCSHVIFVVEVNLHFVVFDVNMEHQVMVLYDGMDINKKEMGTNRPGRITKKESAIQKKLPEDSSLKKWEEIAGMFLRVVLQKSGDLKVNSAVYSKANFEKHINNNNLWLLLSCMALPETVLMLPAKMRCTQKDLYDCGPIVVNHVLGLFQTVTEKLSLKLPQSRAELVKEFVGVTGPTWIRDCVDPNTLVSNDGAERQHVLRTFFPIQSPGSVEDAKSRQPLNNPDADKLIDLTDFNGSDGNAKATKVLELLRKDLLYGLDVEDPYAAWPTDKTYTELNHCCSGLSFLDVPALRLPTLDKRLDQKLHSEHGMPLASITCCHMYNIRNDDRCQMMYTNDMIDFICQW
jgi:hypothetical protein